MMEFLLSRETVITLAIIGGVFSMLASWCQSKGKASEQVVMWINKAAYVCMGVSIILFIAAGLFGNA
jgi:predicted membrane channel-forming protein YqfA (hemolysin III family)